MASRMLNRSVRCTYRNTYSARSLDGDRDYSLVGSPIHGAVLSFEFPRTVVEVVTHWAVRFLSPSGRDSALGAPEPATQERVSSTVATTNLQAIGLTKLLYSVSEAAQLISVSRSTFYALMDSGEILAVYPTSRARIPASALVRFVQTKEDQARQERESLKLRNR